MEISETIQTITRLSARNSREWISSYRQFKQQKRQFNFAMK